MRTIISPILINGKKKKNLIEVQSFAKCHIWQVAVPGFKDKFSLIPGPMQEPLFNIHMTGTEYITRLSDPS